MGRDDLPRDLTTIDRPRNIDRVVYATITLMSVLILSDGWSQLSFIALIGVIIGPVLAMGVLSLGYWGGVAGRRAG